jgi:hypothetical protein
MASDLARIRACLKAKLALAFAGTLVVVVGLASGSALVVVGSATGAMASTVAVPRLQGTIGPGFTISLKQGIAPVRLLKAGRYTFVVADRSSIHNFTLNGPGAANRTITATSFVGTKTVTLTLRRGRYRFSCTVHPTITGTFRVT